MEATQTEPNLLFPDYDQIADTLWEVGERVEQTTGKRYIAGLVCHLASAEVIRSRDLVTQVRCCEELVDECPVDAAGLRLDRSGDGRIQEDG